MKHLSISKWFCLLAVIFLNTTVSHSTPLSGSYTINSALATGGTNFQTFNDFASSINLNGISADVLVTVTAGSGPYTGQVVFNNIAGTGPNATITLDGNNEVLTALTTTTNRHILRLSNCQYFTIINLNIVRDPASTGGFYGIHIYSTGNHITLNNCSVDMTGTNSTLYGGFIASGSETSILETGDFHNITITNNYTTGGGYGASVFGLISNLASNIVIANNTFISYHSNGVYLRETNGVQVYGNFFDKATSTVTSCNAIQLAQAANINGHIFNNVITVSQTSNGTMTQRGIYLFNGTGHKVYNNVISNIQLTSGGYTAIEVRTGGTAPEIYFNTISMDNPVSTNGNLYGIKEELTNTNSVLRNNMISITQGTTGNRTGLALATNSSPAVAFNSDYNDIYVPGGNVAQKGSPLTTITFYPTLANWQSVSGQDSHSISADPVFSSLSLPQPTNGLIDNLGTSISWITNDITGAGRGNPPDMGAYEFSAEPPAAPDTIFGPLEVCEFSENIEYFVTPVTGATSYTWTVTGASLISGQGTLFILVDFTDTPADISVVATNNTGSSSPATMSIMMNPLPVVSLNLTIDTICVFDSPVLLSGGTPAGGTYTGDGITNNEFFPDMAGALGFHTITYTYETPQGCSASATDSIFVDVCPGLPDKVLATPAIQIYPNPVQTVCTVRISESLRGSRIRLYNLTGKEILSFNAEYQIFTLDFRKLSRGLYLLEVISSQGIRLHDKIVY